MKRGETTVLVLDDDANVLDVVREILEAEGYGVLKALNGEEALRVAQAHPGPIALLLTDVVMPGLSGPEAAQRLRATRPDTKVLFMSGFETDHRGLEAIGSEGSIQLTNP